MRDNFGNVYTSSNYEFIQGVNQFTDSLLKYKKNDSWLKLLQSETSMISLTYQAIYEILNGRVTAAKQLLGQAHKHLDDSNERERLNHAAIDAWMSGSVNKAISIHMDITKKYPHDLISVYIVYQHLIIQGRVGELLALTSEILPFHDKNVEVSALHCFALEESRHFNTALEYGFASRDQDSPWGHHSVCHVFDTQAKLDEGIKWMETHSHHWENCINFMNHHNWWHLSLLYLEKGGEDKKILDLYENKVWGLDDRWRSDPSVLSGSIGLLWRAEIAGMKFEKKWDEIVDYVKPIYRDKISNFLDIHMVYALARVGDQDRVEEMVENSNQEVLDMFKFVSKYGFGQYDDSVREVSRNEEFWKIGGSNAQRAVFDFALIDGLQKTDRFDESHQILKPHLDAIGDRWSLSRRTFEYRYRKGINDRGWMETFEFKNKFN